VSSTGSDYLVDHYAVVGIDRDADAVSIAKSARAKAASLHPDRLGGVGEELLVEASWRYEAAILARDVLCDPVAKAAYDAELNGWTGPLSEDGREIVVIGSSRTIGLLAYDEGEFSALEERAAVLSGWDASTGAVLARLHDAHREDEELARAYAEQLTRQEAYLAVAESLRRDALGISDSLPATIGSGHLDDARYVVEEARNELHDRLDTDAAMLTGPVRAALGAGVAPPDGECTEGKAMELAHQRLDGLIDQHSDRLLELAAERVEVVRQRLELVRGRMVFVGEDEPCELWAVYVFGELDEEPARSATALSFVVESDGDDIALNSKGGTRSLPAWDDEARAELTEEAEACGAALIELPWLVGVDPAEVLTSVVGQLLFPNSDD
jgi:curved DNA-binding protein CbpA